MENFTRKIKNLFKKKNIQGPEIINPHKHWIIILWVFFVVIVILIIFSFFMLFKIKNAQLFQVSPTVQDNNNLIREDLLKNVAESFNTKAAKEKELITSPSKYSDPGQ